MKDAWYWLVNGAFAVVIITGNGTVIWLITLRRRLRKTENWFVLSLAVVDFCIGFFMIPTFLVCTFLVDGCLWQVQVLFYELLLFVSVGNLFAMTLDRYIAITRPLMYPRIMKTPRVQIFISVAWFTPAVISLLPLMWRFGGIAEEHGKDAEKVYRAFVIVVFVFLPLVVLSTVYLRIRLLVRKLSRQDAVRRIQLSFNSSLPANTRGQRSPTTRVLGAVITIFACCWVLSSYRSICTFFNLCTVSPLVEKISRLLLFWNSAANPFVYALLKKDIRREMINLFR